MSSVYKKFAGQTFIYGVSTIIARFLYFVLTPYYTRLFKDGIYGIFTNLYANASIINAILAFGMETSFFRYINKHEDKKSEILNNAFWFIFSISTLFLVLGLLFNSQITQFTFNDIKDFENRKLYISFIIWITYFDALSIIPFAKLRADGRPMLYGAIKLINILVCVGLNLGLLWFIPKAVELHWITQPSWYKGAWLGYVLIANLIASGLTFVLLAPQLRKISFNIDVPILKSMLGYSFPILVANLSFIINENIDKIMMTKLLPSNISEVQLGIYGACAKIAVLLNIFIQAYRLGAEPFFFNHAKNENATKTYAQLMNFFVIAVTIIFVGIIANIHIIKHFIGSSYWQGLIVIPLLLMGYVSLGIYMNLSVWYRLTDKTRYGVYISAIGAVITIVLNWIFIPKFSYMAAAGVSCIAYTVMMLVSYLWGQKHYPIPYQVGKCLGLVGLSILFSALSFWVFHKNIFIGNALFITFVMIALYSERTTIKRILKKN